jgi:CBS domain-containing protein
VPERPVAPPTPVARISEPAPGLQIQVRRLLVRPPVACSRETTIAEASRVMAAEGVGSIVVLGPAGSPDGIVTDRDLRQRVLAAGRPVDEPVTTVMSAPVVSISPEAFVFEALLEMTRLNIHHLPVIEAGRLMGMVSSHDLLRLQAAAPLELTRLVHSRTSIEELEAVMPELTGTVGVLFQQGLSGYQIGRIVAELNDLVIRRVLDLVERRLRDTGVGAPPVPFCWLVLGSEGRREQTIRTDQDNALVYEDPTPGLRGQAERYFGTFAEGVIAALVRLGYPPCPGDSMASNPRWRQPLSTWRGYFAAWVRDPVPENLLYSSIYFDFRPVAGVSELAAALRDEVRGQVAAWRSFPRHLGKLAVSHAPPIGLFRRFVLERRNGALGINVKLNGMLLLVNALRAYAVELGLDETNTIERLAAASRAGRCFTDAEAEDVRAAYETIFHFRLRHQLAQIEAGGKPDNFLDPRALSRGDQQRLKGAFRAIQRLQGKVEDRYLTQAI